MEGRDYRCSAVTNATFNHRECPRVRPSKESPKWLRIERDVQASGMSKRAPKQEVTEMVADRTRRSSIGNVQACEHARSHHNDFGHERDLLPSGMFKRERAQEVTTMISSRIGPHIRRQQPGETTSA